MKKSAKIGDNFIRVAGKHSENLINYLRYGAACAADEAAEEALLSRWVDSLPEPVCTEMRTLYAEMAALQTTEAKIYKALDKMEAIVQHNESAIATWEPQEYALNLTYGVEQSQFSPYMQALREAIRQETLRKMEQEGATPQP